jgi:hypothetical protein
LPDSHCAANEQVAPVACAGWQVAFAQLPDWHCDADEQAAPFA